MNIVNAGGTFRVYGEDVHTFTKLPIATYAVGFTKDSGFFLYPHLDLETKEDTVYGKHEARADKILKSFDKADRNFGVIFSGKKGTGKSLLARTLAEKGLSIGLPVIVVDIAIPGIANFLASIEQEVIIIFDEFEKVFKSTEQYDPQVELLGLFDGVNNGKKLFVITCNETKSLNEFLVNRPGRFHYHFNITAPSTDEIIAYMHDKLGNGYEEEIEKLIKISAINELSYDVLRAIVFELKQGYTIEESLEDLNIEYDGDYRFDVKVTLSNGQNYSRYSQYIALQDKTYVYSEWFRSHEKDSPPIGCSFSAKDIVIKDGVLFIPGNKCQLTLDPDDFLSQTKERNWNEAKELAQKFEQEVHIKSVTLNKIVSASTKYTV